MDIFNIEDIVKLDWKITGIYSIIFTNSDKRYIGQAVDIRKRLHRHFYEVETGAHVNVKLSNAIKTYKTEIKLEILHICEREELDKQESYYIEKFNSIENGYNLMLPGEFPKITKEGSKKIKEACNKKKLKVKSFDINTGELIKEYDSLADASRETKLSRQNIRTTCRLNSEIITRSLSGMIFMFSKDCVEGKKYKKEKEHRTPKAKEFKKTPKRWKCVNVYNEDTKEIEEFKSSRQCYLKYGDFLNSAYQLTLVTKGEIIEAGNLIFFSNTESFQEYLKNKI